MIEAQVRVVFHSMCVASGVPNRQESASEEELEALLLCPVRGCRKRVQRNPRLERQVFAAIATIFAILFAVSICVDVTTNLPELTCWTPKNVLQTEMMWFYSGLYGMAPPIVAFADAELSEMARSFYADNKRVGNERIKSELGVTLRYPDYKRGLAALAEEGRESKY